MIAIFFNKKVGFMSQENKDNIPVESFITSQSVDTPISDEKTQVTLLEEIVIAAHSEQSNEPSDSISISTFEINEALSSNETLASSSSLSSSSALTSSSDEKSDSSILLPISLESDIQMSVSAEELSHSDVGSYVVEYDTTEITPVEESYLQLSVEETAIFESSNNAESTQEILCMSDVIEQSEVIAESETIRLEAEVTEIHVVEDVAAIPAACEAELVSQSSQPWFLPEFVADWIGW